MDKYLENLKKKYCEINFKQELANGYSYVKEYSNSKMNSIKPILSSYYHSTKIHSRNIYEFSKEKIANQLKKEEIIDTKYIKLKNLEEKIVFSIEIPKVEVRNNIISTGIKHFLSK